MMVIAVQCHIKLNVRGMNAIFLRKFFECNTIFQVFFHYCQFGFSCDEHKSTPINCNLLVQIMGVTSFLMAEMVGFEPTSPGGLTHFECAPL